LKTETLQRTAVAVPKIHIQHGRNNGLPLAVLNYT
jgi:hypothetical protein